MAGIVYTISVGGIEYDIEAAQVAGTFPIERIARVPGASADVLGLHVWKGAPIPVVDPRPHLGMIPPLGEMAERAMAVVVRLGGEHVAILVESVTGPRADPGVGRQMLDPGSVFGSSAAPPKPDPWADVRSALWKHASFAVSDINIAWVTRKYRSAKWGRVLPSTEKLAADFLAGFGSPCLDTPWNPGLRAGVQAPLPRRSARSFTIWNHFCGRGNDALALACIIAMERPRLKVKIWAVDELAAIVAAETSSWSPAEVPEYLVASGCLIEESGRLRAGAAVRARIILVCAEAFEPVPGSFDMIVCRDRLSYLDAGSQAATIAAFKQALRPEGIVIAGVHERLPSNDWIEQPDAHLSSWKLRKTPRRIVEVLS